MCMSDRNLSEEMVWEASVGGYHHGDKCKKKNLKKKITELDSDPEQTKQHSELYQTLLSVWLVLKTTGQSQQINISIWDPRS